MSKENSGGKKNDRKKIKIPRLFDKSQINEGLNRIGRVKSRNDNDFLHAFLRKLILSVSR